MHANGTPASAIGRNIVSVVRKAAPWLNPVEPTAHFIRTSRFELRNLEEALAAWRVAKAWRVRQLGFDETTKFQEPSMVTSVLIQAAQGAATEVVILRAAYSTGGATSALSVVGIEEKCFARLRQLLRGWQAKCLEMFPEHRWTGPDPERCGLQRLGGGGAIINDTCTPARCTQRLLIAEVARQVQAKHPDWGSLSEAQQEAAVRCHALHCWQHMRNIILAAMQKAQAAHVKAALEEQLLQFSSFERMSTDFDQLLRADYKVPFVVSCLYLYVTIPCDCPSHE